MNNVERLIGGEMADALDYSSYINTSSDGSPDEGVSVDPNAESGTLFNSLVGFTHVTGTALVDQIRGDDHANIPESGDGNDRISGGAGADFLSGGLVAADFAGITDVLVETRDVDFILINTRLRSSNLPSGPDKIDTLSGFEHAELMSGPHSNQLDAQGFTKPSVNLDGG